VALILGWLFKTVVKLLIVILRSPTAICMLSLVAITSLVHRGLGLAPVLMGCGFLLLGIGLLVRMLPDQTVEDWTKVSDRLCQEGRPSQPV